MIKESDKLVFFKIGLSLNLSLTMLCTAGCNTRSAQAFLEPKQNVNPHTQHLKDNSVLWLPGFYFRLCWLGQRCIHHSNWWDFRMHCLKEIRWRKKHEQSDNDIVILNVEEKTKVNGRVITQTVHWNTLWPTVPYRVVCTQLFLSGEGLLEMFQVCSLSAWPLNKV